ncbi:eukaryotic translation initiation factor 4 gamma 3-like [Platichthys flesus]|uniref:eukaryotic translation initiation factor 4 gamma 3-like n=1 Tax=Platichthys flesus TaxID=8260 RepID=UPI002DB94B46|nr:eukaryotic translation initiation factor 4 gamma 3-like [Platichthys flesus]
MDHYFNCMETIAKASQTSSRIRFTLQDTIDLRLQNWVPRRADLSPKTIEQIHMEPTIEEQEEQRNLQQQLFSKDTKRQPDPEEQEDQLTQGEETWNTYDPSKMPKFCKPQMEENTYLGPPSQVTWVKGSSGGAKAIDSDEAPEVQPVGERSSSPGLMQPEAPVERLEAQSTPPTSEPELPLPSTLSTLVNLPLRKSRTEMETAAHEPSLMPPAALQPQASSPTDREVSSETVASDMRPQVPTPPQTPDSDARKTLESSEELLESPTPQRVTQDPAPEPETSRAPEPVKPETVVQMTEKPARSAEMIKRKSILEEFLHMNNSKSDTCSSEATVSERSWSPGVLTHQMQRHLLEDMASEKKIFNCVKEKLVRSHMSSSHYLRELMTAVCKAAVKENTNCRVHTALIQKRMPLYLNYRSSQSERQRHALQELQALIVTLDQPPNLLRIFFECLKHQDVISVDASFKWGTSEDPAEQLGKGVALKTITAFFHLAAGGGVRRQLTRGDPRGTSFFKDCKYCNSKTLKTIKSI